MGQQPGMMGGQQGTVTYKDFDTVTLNGQVIKAYYSPPGQWNDVTQQIKNLQQQGRNVIQGGIHTAIGDPAPGTPKKFRVCLWERPSQQWPDLVQVQFQGTVIAASYAPAGQFNDFTQQVRNLQQQGRNVVDGGIHTAIGDPNPGTPKQFLVWYS